jgi:PAS fold.
MVAEGCASGSQERMCWADVPIIRQDETRFVTARNIPLPGNDLMISTVWDVTERKRAEEELRTSNELLSLFIRNSPIYAFIKEVTPDESRVLAASENFQDMVGIPGSRMIGKTMADLFPAHFAAKITADDWDVVSRGEILRSGRGSARPPLHDHQVSRQLGGKNSWPGTPSTSPNESRRSRPWPGPRRRPNPPARPKTNSWPT